MSYNTKEDISSKCSRARLHLLCVHENKSSRLLAGAVSGGICLKSNAGVFQEPPEHLFVALALDGPRLT